MKRGLSTIVSTLLILLLVFVAVAILWVVVRNVIQSGTEQVSLGKFTLDLKIDQVSVDEATNEVSVRVRRDQGEGEFVGIKIIVSDDENSEIYNENISLKVHGKKTFKFYLNDLDVSEIIQIQIVPIFRLSSGKEVSGDVKDTWEKSVSGFASEDEVEMPSEEEVGQKCTSETEDEDCTTDYYSKNFCSGEDIYRNLFDFSCNASNKCSYTVVPELVQDCSLTNATCQSAQCVVQEQENETEQCTGDSTQSCTITNGFGQQTRTCTDGVWSDWGTCTVVNCSDGYEISGNECVSTGGEGEFNVIGPHEFWTHENARSGDYVGYVKYFDMQDLNPTWSIVSGNDGSFAIGSSTGLITISDRTALDVGSTYNLGVRLQDSSKGKLSTANVIIHVADEDDVVYLSSSASNSGEDGSYEHPFNSLKSDIGSDNFEEGKVYLLKRGSSFPTAGLQIDNPDATAAKPIVIGAYGTGNRPILDGSAVSDGFTIRIGKWSTSNPPDATGYIYMQNIHFKEGDRAITNGAYIADSSPTGHHHLTFLDIKFTNCGIFWWSRNQHDYDIDHDIVYVNLEMDNGGAKLYPGGMEFYNTKSYGNTDGTGFRWVLSGPRVLKGAEFSNNANNGIQIRTSNTLLEYAKIHHNGQQGINMYKYAENNGDIPGVFTVDKITLRNVEIYNNGKSTNPYSGGVWFFGMMRDIVFDNVSIHDNYGRGIYAYPLYDSDTYGPLSYSPLQRITIKNSKIYNNEEQGIFVHESRDFSTDDVVIENNKIYGNGEEGIKLENVKGGSIKNNVIYGNGVNEIVEVDVTGVVKSGNQIS